MARDILTFALDKDAWSRRCIERGYHQDLAALRDRAIVCTDCGTWNRHGVTQKRRDPDAIVCEFCLEEPPACDCDTSGGGASNHLIRYGDAIARRLGPHRTAQAATSGGRGLEVLPEVQRSDVA